MSWKTDIQLRDLKPEQRLELTCLKCGVVHFRQASELLKTDKLFYAWLDEVEDFLQCNQRGCRGAIRLAIAVDADTEGFSGGLA